MRLHPVVTRKEGVSRGGMCRLSALKTRRQSNTWLLVVYENVTPVSASAVASLHTCRYRTSRRTPWRNLARRLRYASLLNLAPSLMVLKSPQTREVTTSSIQQGWISPFKIDHAADQVAARPGPSLMG